jgi:hypothetical protein
MKKQQSEKEVGGDTRLRIVDLRKEGCTFKEIEMSVGVPIPTIIKILKSKGRALKVI